MPNMKIFMRISSIAAAAAMGVLTGCASWGHQRTDERTEGRMVDDHRITQSVQSELKDEPVFKFNGVDVKTFNGIVQLSGFVNTEEQKRRAGELAQHVPGVTQVVNNISLKPEVPTPTGRPVSQP